MTQKSAAGESFAPSPRKRISGFAIASKRHYRSISSFSSGR